MSESNASGEEGARVVEGRTLGGVRPSLCASDSAPRSFWIAIVRPFVHVDVRGRSLAPSRNEGVLAGPQEGQCPTSALKKIGVSSAGGGGLAARPSVGSTDCVTIAAPTHTARPSATSKMLTVPARRALPVYWGASARGM